MIAVLVEHPLADVDGFHGTYVVGIWEVVVPVGLLVDDQQGTVVSLLMDH